MNKCFIIIIIIIIIITIIQNLVRASLLGLAKYIIC